MIAAPAATASPTFVRFAEQRKIGENAVWCWAVPERRCDVHFGNGWTGAVFVFVSRYPSKTIRIKKERVKSKELRPLPRRDIKGWMVEVLD